MNNIVVDNNLIDKIDTINFNIGVSTNAILFLVSFIVVIVVCYLLYKAVDNFISF